MKDYSNLKDEELLLEYKKTGDEYALNILIVRFQNLIAKCAAPFFMVGADREDLIQEGRIGLLDAIRAYDEHKNDSFIPFAKLCIQRAQMKAVEASNRKKHAPLNSYVSIDSNDNSTDISSLDTKVSSPEDIIFDEYKIESILDEIEDSLSHKEMEVLLFMIEGYDYKEIASKLGCEAKSIDNTRQRIRSKVGQIIKQSN